MTAATQAAPIAASLPLPFSSAAAETPASAKTLTT
jgi:hypothetical protein